MINISIVTYLTDKSEIVDIINLCLRNVIVNEILIIDNSPNNRISKYIEDLDKTIYIHNPSNPGYGSGHNIGLKRSLSNNIRYHLVLNADVCFEPNLLDSLFAHAKDIDNLGILSPKMLYEDGSIQYSRKLLPTPLNMFIRMFVPKKFRTRFDAKFQLETFDVDLPILVPYVSGAFMFINTDSLREVGLFDELYFMYPEDIDLSRRVAEKYKVLYCPKFTIIHKYGGASHKSVKMLFIHAYNMILYFNKWGWIFDSKRKILNNKTQNKSFCSF